MDEHQIYVFPINHKYCRHEAGSEGERKQRERGGEKSRKEQKRGRKAIIPKKPRPCFTQ